MKAPTTPPASDRQSHIKDLILLFSIPAGMALIAAAFVYIPSLLANPAYSFIYTYCPSYGCVNDSYMVDSDGQLVQVQDRYEDNLYSARPRLALYDAESDATRTLTYEEARKVQLINSSKSPDDYVLEHNSGSTGFLFWSDRTNDWRLVNGMKKKLVKLDAGDEYSANDINFIGWVKK